MVGYMIAAIWLHGVQVVPKKSWWSIRPVVRPLYCAARQRPRRRAPIKTHCFVVCVIYWYYLGEDSDLIKNYQMILMTRLSHCIDWCCLCYAIGNSLVALLEALFARKGNCEVTWIYQSTMEWETSLRQKLPSKTFVCLVYIRAEGKDVLFGMRRGGRLWDFGYNCAIMNHLRTLYCTFSLTVLSRIKEPFRF